MADYSNVLALSGKALKSFSTGGFGRAAAYYAEAFEAARALNAAADCVIVACLQSWYAYAMLVHGDKSGMVDSEKVPVLLKLVPVLDEAAAAVQSRRAAGSLKSAGLRPAESAFALTFSQLQFKHAGYEKPGSAVAESAGLIMHTTYMRVATCTLMAQTKIVALLAMSGPAALAQEPGMLNMGARYDFVASALDLIAEPRAEAPGLHVEAELIDYIEEFASNGQLAVLSPSTAAAWERLQRSGVIRERGIAMFGKDDLKRLTAKVESAAAAKVAARGLRSCALATCAAREVQASQFKNCGACKTVVYCCREHQVADWPAHKAACKAARKASAASAAPSDA